MLSAQMFCSSLYLQNMQTTSLCLDCESKRLYIFFCSPLLKTLWITLNVCCLSISIHKSTSCRKRALSQQNHQAPNAIFSKLTRASPMSFLFSFCPKPNHHCRMSRHQSYPERFDIQTLTTCWHAVLRSIFFQNHHASVS